MRVSAEQQIHIEQLKVFARVGVPQTERARRQRLVLNITLWPRVAPSAEISGPKNQRRDPQVCSQRRGLRFRECDAERVSRMICVRDVFNNH